MQLVEMMVVMGLKEGDELCLSYLVDDRMEGKVNEAGEFLVDRVRWWYIRTRDLNGNDGEKALEHVEYVFSEILISYTD